MFEAGGYLIPKILYRDKPGTMSAICRFIGSRLRLKQIYRKGVEAYDVEEALLSLSKVAAEFNELLDRSNNEHPD